MPKSKTNATTDSARQEKFAPAAHETVQKQPTGNALFQFEDRRLTTAAQKKQQGLMNPSEQQNLLVQRISRKGVEKKPNIPEKQSLEAPVQAVFQFQRRDPSGTQYVNSNSVNVWLSNVVTRQGHLFSKDVGHKATKEALIASITEFAAARGVESNLRTWVTQTGDYNQPTEANTDPYRIRIHGTFGAGPTAYSVDVHYGPYHHGYVVNVVDGAATGEISDRGRTFSGGAPLADFSSTHHDHANSALLGETNVAGNTARTSEQKLDASTKLIGEGARFQSVAKHRAHLADSTKFFIHLNAATNTNMRWITFRDLWLTWSATFNKAFSITHASVKQHVTADDFTRIGPLGVGTVALPVGTGAPTDITVGRDFSLDYEVAADAHDTHTWHALTVNLPSSVRTVNQTKKNQVTRALEGVQGVVKVNGSSTGKTYTVTAWDTVTDGDLKVALPDWAKAEEVKEEESEDESTPSVSGPSISLASASASSVQVPEGLDESSFFRVLNARLVEYELGKQLTAQVKQAVKDKVTTGKGVVGLRYRKRTKRYVHTSTTKSLDQILDTLIKGARVEFVQQQSTSSSSSTAHTESEELVEMRQEITRHGGKRKGSGYVLPVMLIFILIALGLLYFFWPRQTQSPNTNAS